MASSKHTPAKGLTGAERFLFFAGVLMGLGTLAYTLLNAGGMIAFAGS